MRSEKKYILQELRDKYYGSSLMVVTSYHGLPSDKMTKLRNQLFGAKAKFMIIPNRMTKKAMPEIADTNFGKILLGPNALAATTSDIVELAKALKTFADEVKNFEIKGGMLDCTSYLTKADIIALASLPPRQVLLGQVVGTLAAPIRNTAGTLYQLLAGFARVVDALAQKKNQ